MSELVIFHKQLGDTVLLEPVLRKLAEASGQQVQLLCPASLSPLIELMPHTRLATGRGRWLPRRVWAYDWGGRTARAALLTLCREKHLLIPNPLWVKWCHRLAFQHIHAEDYRERYVSRYFWDHTKVEGMEQVFSPARLEMPPDDWAATLGNREPYLLINPVSAWKRKSYDTAKWAIVLAHARDLGMTRVVMTGGTGDWQRAHCSEIAAQASAAGVVLEDASGRTTLREFLHLISRAKMVVCVDGAAAHLARGFGVPCVSIFGPSYRWLWHLEDQMNAALDASDFSHEHRPDASLVSADSVISAVTRVAANVSRACG